MENARPSRKHNDAARVGHPTTVGHPTSVRHQICAVALLDISTGEFRTLEFAGPNARAQAVDAIVMAGASEGRLPTSAEIPAGLERPAARTRADDWWWS